MIVDGNSADKTKEIALEKEFEFTLSQERAMVEHTGPGSSLQR